MQANAPAAGTPNFATYTPAQTRVLEAALFLFSEHGIGGTSLKMIADAIGVTKAAVYHQYNTKDEIVLAIAEVVVAGLETGLTVAEAERSAARRREVLIGKLSELAVERRHMAGILQQDPVMLRFLQEHERFRCVMERMNHILMGAATTSRAKVQAAIVATAIAGAVIHPLVHDLDDRTLRLELTRQLQKLFPLRA